MMKTSPNAEAQARWRVAHMGTDRKRVVLDLDIKTYERLRRLVRLRGSTMTTVIRELIAQAEG